MGGINGEGPQTGAARRRIQLRIAVPDFFGRKAPAPEGASTVDSALKRELMEACKRDLRQAYKVPTAAPRNIRELRRSERVRAALAG